MILLKKITVASTLLFSAYFIYAQGKSSHEHKVTDSNPVYTITGNGVSNSETQKKLSFSSSQNNSEIEVSDNAVKVKKDGIYRFTLNNNLSAVERKQKDINYYASVNGKEVFIKNERNLPANGECYFQIQLKANDLIAFNLKGNQEIQNNELENTLKIQFTDPALIKIEDNH